MRSGQHTHAVEHAHTILSQDPEPEGPGPKTAIDGSMPAFTSSPFTMSYNDPNPRHREGFRLPASAFPCRPVAGMAGAMVGPGRFERPTSPLSGVRSNQLSYGPGTPENGTTTQASKSRPASGSERKGSAGDGPGSGRHVGTVPA